MDYRKYIKSAEWKVKRQAKLEDCHGICECEEGCCRKATQIHHLHYDTLGNESFEDLQALCAKCHMKKSGVREFYGNVPEVCCLKKSVNPIDEEYEKKVQALLPTAIMNELEAKKNIKNRMDQVSDNLSVEETLETMVRIRQEILQEIIVEAIEMFGGLPASGKILPYTVYHEANFHLSMNPRRYIKIAKELKAPPIIAALLDNFGIMFACGDIAVEDKITQAIERFVDVVDASEANLGGYCDVAYKIKPEFAAYFQ